MSDVIEEPAESFEDIVAVIVDEDGVFVDEGAGEKEPAVITDDPNTGDDSAVDWTLVRTTDEPDMVVKDAPGGDEDLMICVLPEEPMVVIDDTGIGGGTGEEPVTDDGQLAKETSEPADPSDIFMCIMQAFDGVAAGATGDEDNYVFVLDDCVVVDDPIFFFDPWMGPELVDEDGNPLALPMTTDPIMQDTMVPAIPAPGDCTPMQEAPLIDLRAFGSYPLF